jgi:rhodanese-related sulfurtransferase
MSRERFVEIVTADQPDTPAYFTYDAVLNSRERPTLDDALERELQPLALAQLLDLVSAGAQLLDAREQSEFEGAHIRGALNIGLGGSFATWSGTLLDQSRPVVLVAEPGREAEAATRLGRIGFDNVAGYLAGGMQQLDGSPELVGRVERITAASLAEELGRGTRLQLIDVRTAREYAEGHIDGALNLPLAQLPEHLDEVPRDRPTVVYCASGYRSSVAVSLLRRAGMAGVANLVGGLAAWRAAEPASRAPAPAPAAASASASATASA